MNSEEILKEIMKSPILKSLLGVSKGNEIGSIELERKEIKIINYLIEGQINGYGEDHVFQNIKKLFDL